MDSVKVIQWILWSAFYLACPALLLYICKRYSFFKKIGEVVLAYAIGILLGNTVITKDYTPLLEGISYLTILLAIPLVLFSVNVRSFKILAGKALLSFVLALVALIIVLFAGFFIFKNHIEEPTSVAGMMAGVYVGGTVNVVAIAQALKASNHIFITVTTVDIIVSMVYFLVLISFGKNVLARWLPPYKGDKTNGMEIGEPATKKSYNRKAVLRLLSVIGIAVCIDVIAAAAVGFKFAETWQMAVFILLITTLAIIAASFKYVHETKGTFNIGYYLIISFCLVIGSMADLTELLHASPWIFCYAALTVFGTLSLHVLFSKLFKIDRDTTIITSFATIFSPPFVPVMAAVLKNRSIILPGITVGILGYAVGNYLGVAIAYLLEFF